MFKLGWEAFRDVQYQKELNRLFYSWGYSNFGDYDDTDNINSWGYNTGAEYGGFYGIY